MIAPAAPPTTAPMIAPRAVEPVLLPITPPTAAPVVAPMMAPFSLALSDAHAGASAASARSGTIRADGREKTGCTAASGDGIACPTLPRAAGSPLRQIALTARR